MTGRSLKRPQTSVTRAPARRLYIAIAIVGVALACGRDAVSPTSDQDDDPRSLELALAAANRNVCQIVVWRRSTSGATQEFSRTRIPGAASDGVSDSLWRLRAARFSRADGLKVWEAVCVIPFTPDAEQAAVGFLRNWRPPDESERALAETLYVAQFTEFSGTIYCYWDAGDILHCNGVSCGAEMLRTPASGAQFGQLMATPSAQRNPTGSSPSFVYYCDNGCDVYAYEGYTCPGGSGDLDMGGTGGSGSPALTLTCTPTTVLRGNTVSCSAYAANVPSGLTAAYRFTFTPDSGMIPVERDTADVSDSWGGEVAIGGTVSATAKIGNETVSSSPVGISVTPRSWSSEKPGFEPVDRGTGDLNIHPEVPADLGDTWVDSVSVSGIYQPISGGPNAGMRYTTAMYTQWYMIRINYAALTDTSDLAALQQGGQDECTASDVAPSYLNFVKAHEGIGLESNSHAERHKTKLSSYDVGSKVEAIVTQYDLLEADITVRLTTEMDAARAQSAALDDDPPPGPCNLRFFSP